MQLGIVGNCFQFIGRYCFVCMAENESPESDIGVGQSKHIINVLPIMSQQPTYSIAVSFGNCPIITVPIAFECAINIVPVLQTVRLVESVFLLILRAGSLTCCIRSTCQC